MCALCRLGDCDAQVLELTQLMEYQGMLADSLPSAALAHEPGVRAAACAPQLEPAVDAAAATAASSSSNARDLQGVSSWANCTILELS